MFLSVLLQQKEDCHCDVETKNSLNLLVHTPLQHKASFNKKTLTFYIPLCKSLTYDISKENLGRKLADK